MEGVRAELEAPWATILKLYATRPAVGTLGAEVVGLALEAEDLVKCNPSRTRAPIKRAGELLQDPCQPATLGTTRGLRKL